MILLLAGTVEGRMISERLLDMNQPHIVSVATERGRDSLSPTWRTSRLVEVSCGRLNCCELKTLIESRGVSTVVDATHPYAVRVSAEAKAACLAVGVRYVRFERPRMRLPVSELICRVPDLEAAADLACAPGARVMLTVGAAGLGVFARLAQGRQAELIVRVLPGSNGISACADLGISPENVIAAEGPFTVEQNLSLIRDQRITALVTKDSGLAGGAQFKVEAAVRAGITAVVIERPPGDAGDTSSIAELLSMLLEISAKGKDAATRTKSHRSPGMRADRSSGETKWVR